MMQAGYYEQVINYDRPKQLPRTNLQILNAWLFSCFC